MRAAVLLLTILVCGAPLAAQAPGRPDRVVVRKVAGKGFIYLKYDAVSPERVIRAVAANQGWQVHLDRNVKLDSKPRRGLIDQGDALEVIRWLALAAGVEVDFNEETRVVFLHAPYRLGRESAQLQQAARELYRQQAKRWLVGAIAAGRGGSLVVDHYETLVDLILSDGGGARAHLEAEGYLKQLSGHYDRSIKALETRLNREPTRDPAAEEKLVKHRRRLVRTLIRLGECYLAATDLARASQAVNKFQDALGILALLEDRGDLYYQAKAGEIKARIRNGENVGLENLEREIERIRSRDIHNWGQLKLLAVEGYYLAARREAGEGRLDRARYNDRQCLRSYEQLAANKNVVLGDKGRRAARYFGGHAAFHLARTGTSAAAGQSRADYLYAKAIRIMLPLVTTPGKGGIRHVEWSPLRTRTLETHLTLARALLVPRIAERVKGTNCPLLALRILANVHTLDAARLVEYRDQIDKNRIISTTGAYVVRWLFGPDTLVQWGESSLACLEIFGTLEDQRALYEWIDDQLAKMAANMRMGQLQRPARLPADLPREALTRYRLAPAVGLELARIYLDLARDYRKRFLADQSRAQQANALALLESMAFQKGPAFHPARVRWVELLMETGEPREVIQGTARLINHLRARVSTVADRQVLSRLFTLRMQAFLAEDNHREAELASQGRGVGP